MVQTIINLSGRWIEYGAERCKLRYAWDESWLRPGESFRNMMYLLAKRNVCSIKSALKRHSVTSQKAMANGNYVYCIDPTLPIKIDLATLSAKMQVPERTLWLGTLLPFADAWFSRQEMRSSTTFKRRFFGSILAPSLRYCPTCMQEGYHSPLHQFLPVRCCLRHEVPIRLVSHCPHCGLRPWEMGGKCIGVEEDTMTTCSFCHRPLSKARREEASTIEVDMTLWVQSIWDELTDPDWTRLPFRDALGRIDFLSKETGFSNRPILRRFPEERFDYYWPQRLQEQRSITCLSDLLNWFYATGTTPTTLCKVQLPDDYETSTLSGLDVAYPVVNSGCQVQLLVS